MMTDGKPKNNRREIVSVSLIVATIFMVTIVFISVTLQPNVSANEYSVTIDRMDNSDFSKEIILKAEQVVPPDGSWYNGSQNYVKLADSVNNEALLYYIDLIHKIRKDHDYTGKSWKKANFEYRASVFGMRTTGVFENGTYIPIESNTTHYVKLTITLDLFFSPKSSMTIHHYRQVKFNDQGEILSVENDDTRPLVAIA